MAKHELPPGMPFTQVMGVIPYDVAGLKQHLGTVFADAAKGSGGVKLVTDATHAIQMRSTDCVSIGGMVGGLPSSYVRRLVRYTETRKRLAPP